MDEPMTPFIKIDIQKVKDNINRMTSSLAKYNIRHRPHIKTHKSVELAKLELKAGAVGITCATLSELEIMVKGGISNILLAFPLIGKEQYDKLYDILNKYDFEFTTIVDSEPGIRGLAQIGKRLNRSINVYVDIDSGGHREGVQSEDVLEFTKKVIDTKYLHFKGLFTYYGHIYKYDKKEHKEKTKEEANILIRHKHLLEENGIEVSVLSGGSTVSSNYPEQLQGITESRAGNFIFYDMNAVHLGLVDPEHCALRVVAKVVSTPVPGKASIDAGSKALSTDQPLKGDAYGYIINRPELKIVNLNEEHGFIEYDPKLSTVQVGDIVEIIPNHACVVPNLANKAFLFESEQLIKAINIDARGRNY